jgi:hypothetical protein
MMKRLLISLILLLFAIPASEAQVANLIKVRSGDADTTAVTVGYQYPMPTQEIPFNSFLTVATPSFMVSSESAKVIGTLPAGTRVITVGTVGGALCFGGSSVATGTEYPFAIASGSFRDFNVSTTTPAIYVIGQLGTVTVHLLAR